MSRKPASFSVIVTCYNYKNFVAEAVDGALAQTRAAAQIIVVDDGSTDGSIELLRERYGGDARVTLLFGENGGQLAAFQRGTAVATGDVLCYLDADDRWLPDYLQKIGAVYDARPDIDFVFTDVQLFGSTSKRVGYADGPLDFGYTIISTYLLAHWYGSPTSAVSLRAVLARRCLDLPENFRQIWRISADNCLVYGAGVLGGRKYYLPTGSVEYRVHGNNGWYTRRSDDSEYVNHMRSMGLCEFYGRSVGLTASCVEMSDREWLTKPTPTMAEARRYIKLVRRTRGSWFKRRRRVKAIRERAEAFAGKAPSETLKSY